jgi:hypothetical protein
MELQIHDVVGIELLWGLTLLRIENRDIANNAISF